MANRLLDKPKLHFIQGEPIPDAWGQFIFNSGDVDSVMDQYPGLMTNAELYSSVDNFSPEDQAQLVYGYGTIRVQYMYVYGTDEVSPRSDCHGASNVQFSVFLYDDAITPEIKDWIRTDSYDGSAFVKDCGTSNTCNESGTEFKGWNKVVGNCNNCDEKWHELGYGRRLILFDDHTYCHANNYPGAYMLGAPESGNGWWWQLVGSTMEPSSWWSYYPDNSSTGDAWNMQTFPSVSCGTTNGMPTGDISSCSPNNMEVEFFDWDKLIDRDAFLDYDIDGSLYFMLNMHTSHRTYIDCDAWCDYSCDTVDDGLTMYKIPKRAIYDAWATGKEKSIYFTKTDNRNSVITSTSEFYPVPGTVRQDKSSRGLPWRGYKAAFKIYPPGTTDHMGTTYDYILPEDVPENQRSPGFTSDMWLDSSNHLYPLVDDYGDNFIAGIDFTQWSPETKIDFQRLKKLGNDPYNNLLSDTYSLNQYKNNNNYFLPDTNIEYRPVSYIFTEKVKYLGEEDGLYYYDEIECTDGGQTCFGEAGCEEFYAETTCLYGNSLTCDWGWEDQTEGQTCQTEITNVYLQKYFDRETEEENYKFSTAPLQITLALGLTTEGQANPPTIMNPILTGEYLVGEDDGFIYGVDVDEVEQCNANNLTAGCLDLPQYYFQKNTGAIWDGVIGVSLKSVSDPTLSNLLGTNISDITTVDPWYSESKLYGDIYDSGTNSNVVRGAIHKDGIGFKWFVTNWDWQEDDPDGTDIIAELPASMNQMTLKQDRENLYKWQYVYDEDGNHGTLSHVYTSGGNKIIKAVVVSYMHHPYGDLKARIQPLRWKLMTIKLNVNIDEVFVQDFGELGGKEFTFIPWNETSPVIGGIQWNSSYRNSLKQLVQEGKFASNESWDRLLADKAYNNDELGQYFGNSDLGQVRYMNKPYDMYTLLNLTDGDDEFHLYDDFYFWDGINNHYSPNSCVGKLFINDHDMLEIKNSTIFELNFDRKDLSHIPDTYGNKHRGILLGDYSVKKTAKGQKTTRDRQLKTPNIKTSKVKGAF